LSPEDAGKSVIKAAQEAGLDAARLKRLEEDGLDFEIQDSETKFKVFWQSGRKANIAMSNISIAQQSPKDRYKHANPRLCHAQSKNAQRLSAFHHLQASAQEAVFCSVGQSRVDGKPQLAGTRP
jgi:hypothetical protein